MTYPDWRAYQEETAEVFRRLGCNVQIEHSLNGVRSEHKIDVYATFMRSSIHCSWVIECKFWKTKVTKEKVLALKSVIDDVGADRGIIVSEMGFQPGAQDAARGTNITLVTSLEEFEKTALAAASEIPLLLNDQYEGASIYQFPHRAGPNNLLAHGEYIISANWAGCSISIINPVSKSVVRTIELDKYEATSPQTKTREIRGYPPGSLGIADGKLFIGQVFSEVIIVVDLATHAVVKRISVPGGGHGEIAVSPDEKIIYFASNKLNQFYIIDTATYDFKTVAYPAGGRGCMSLLAHPKLPLIYIGIQRGGRINGRSYPHANCYVAIYDLLKETYVATSQLAEIINGITDDATPACLTYDEIYNRLYVGMFQSMRGICVLEPESGNPIQEIRFNRSPWNNYFHWPDPLSQALTDNFLLTVNRNNCELAVVDRNSLHHRKSIFLGQASNGPNTVLALRQHAVISYPDRNGLIFIPLEALSA